MTTEPELGAPGDQREELDRTVQGARWGVVSGICEQLGTIGTTIVLARLLGPREFGLVAVATILLNLLHLFGSVGLGASLIKRPSIDEPVLSTTFWASAGLGAALTAILIGLAPVLSRAMSEPDATPYVMALAPLLLITMVSNVSEAQLLRGMRFRWVYSADIANIALYAAITLAMAALGAGAWSMVVGRVLGELGATLLRLIGAGWLPRWTFHWAAIRTELRFTGGFLLLQVTNFVTRNVDYWVVSFTLGATSLGVYYVAFVLPTLLRQRMTWLSTDLLMPVMARARDDVERLVGLYRESLQFLAFVSVPILAGIALTAPQVVEIGFGDQWGRAVTPMRWLAVAAIVEVGASTGSVAFLALGRAGVPSRMGVVRMVLMGVGLLVAVQVGASLAVVAAVVTIATALSTVAIHQAVRITLGVPFHQVLRWLAPILAGVAVMAGVVVALTAVVEPWAVALQAATLAGAGAAAYVATLLVVDRAFTSAMVHRLLRIAGRRPSTA